MKKPKLLLLDSDVVITCYELEVWESLKTKFEIHVTSIVATIEVKFASTPTGKIAIDLEDQAARGEIEIVEATASEMASVLDQFAATFSQGLDDGETEGMAVMSNGSLEDCKFCMGDTNGIQAVGMLGLAAQSISLEEILELSGLRSGSQKLPAQFSKRNHEIQIKTGVSRRITCEYFRKPPLGL